MLKILLSIALVHLSFLHYSNGQCASPSITTASGSHAPTGTICSGDLIFEDNFDELDLSKWNHEETLAGGGNWEFEWYTNNRENSYVNGGVLYIKPTLLADEKGEDFLWSGTIDIPANQCTTTYDWGCSRTGTPTNYLNPIKSARMRTVDSLSFKYGRVEVRAKLPSGDWLWPAIWFLPTYSVYSSWPASGEIDLMESRGNRNLVDGSGANIGTQLFGSTLHWGPNQNFNKFMMTHVEKRNPEGYDANWHNYQMRWTDNEITFSVDDEVVGTFAPPAGGFWEWGNLDSSGLPNPWINRSKMAPFDQEFHVILNLAIGGVNYFPDDANNPGGKPWENSSGAATTDFWKGKDQWLPTWHLETDSAALKVDYVRIWAL